MMLTGIACLLAFVAVLASVVAVALRRRAPLVAQQVAYTQANAPAFQPRPRSLHYRRSPAEREAERAMILAALLAGVDAVLIARCLRGSASWNRRKVATVRRLNEQRLQRPSAEVLLRDHIALRGI